MKQNTKIKSDVIMSNNLYLIFSRKDALWFSIKNPGDEYYVHLGLANALILC